MAKTLRIVHPNRGIEARYKKKLVSAIETMQNSVYYWISAAYKKFEPKMAQDAVPSKQMNKVMSALAKRWQKKWDSIADNFAENYAKGAFKTSNTALASAFKDAGWSVEFAMTPIMRDALSATTAENVALIKSIPQNFFQSLVGDVMRAYSQGRDLEHLQKTIMKTGSVTKKRASLIARDQTSKAHSVVTKARYEELGITEAIWVHSSAGKKPRPDHVAANGKRYNVEEGCKISGEYIQPGELINCRCVSRAVLPF